MGHAYMRPRRHVHQETSHNHCSSAPCCLLRENPDLRTIFASIRDHQVAALLGLGYHCHSRFTIHLNGSCLGSILVPARKRNLELEYCDEGKQAQELRFFFVGIVNLVAEVVLLILPLPCVAKLQINRRKKIGVMAMFLTGVFGTIFAVLSNYYRAQLFYFHQTSTGNDVTWTAGLTEIA